MLLPLALILIAPSAFATDPVAFTFPVTSTATVALKARPTTVYKPHSLDAFHRARWRSLNFGESEPLEWEPQDVLGPDVEDLHTLAQLARMTGNAYALPGKSNWYDVDPAWNTSFPFGWEDSTDGFRGHVFMSSDNSTVVLSIKGTTLQGPTSKKDKYNDNLLFSCCCARVDISWVFSTVCDCYKNSWRCDNTCLTQALIEDSLFYSVGVKLVNDLFFLYPTANVWLVGHSLGGALAALLATTFGLPAVAFESPGERLAANRLHLPMPHDRHLSAHFPPQLHMRLHRIGSVCAQGGFALETRCHLGKSIVFDTHVIKDVITKVLEAEGIVWEEGRSVPLAREEVDCVDCYKWEFSDFLDDKVQLS
ncbi:Alpha/Beta hydrolase protein [Mycena sp. CBHHK59/15]|nr:Alpha/Beta hydrolase protein [Mycena sp. CBHHK59/15]